MSAVTTHVLDTARGVPAAGVLVRLERVSGADRAEIARTRTGSDGRASGLGSERLPPGTYRLIFDTADYFASLRGAVGRGGEGGHGAGEESGPGGSRGAGSRDTQSRSAFFPEVAITFTADTADGDAPHYHVPLLLSPFGYATYRGS